MSCGWVGATAVLNVGKLAAGQQEYYLAVAAGVEDYYLGKGEAPGGWLGSASAELGLEAEVDAEDLRAVLSLRDPRSGDPLNRARVPGFDLTFRAPKSVSLLYGLGEAGSVTAEVVAAHDAAVGAALSYLEDHACAVRFRVDGRITAVRASGFVAAGFRHRTSRAGDPTFHTHVLVANASTTPGGRWGALDGARLYHHAKAAGFVYQAVLRGELTRRLGVEWGPVRNGTADIQGIPRSLIEAFSKRRAEIVSHMASRGETSARAAQVATLETRRAKDYPVDVAALRASWAAAAEAHGFGPEQVAALIEDAAERRREPGLPALASLVGALAGPRGLTEHASTFERRDAIQGVCERLPEGADLDTIEALTDAFLADERVLCASTRGGLCERNVIRVSDGRVFHPARDEARYSTWALPRVERHLLDSALARAGDRCGIADPATLSQVLTAAPGLSAEQAATVEAVCSSGRGVEVVVGRAGSGKTTALGAARQVWERSGYRVIGCALSARAAAELEAGSGIASSTLDRLLLDLDATGGLRPSHVIVVDEAGMVGTRKLARLLAHAQGAGAKVVLVGDHHQLPEVEAGGAFRALVRRLGAIELRANHRQREAWERRALQLLRDGEVDRALGAYHARGRVTCAETPTEAIDALVERWWQARHGGRRVLMVAPRRSQVRALNEAARDLLDAAGHLDQTGPRLRVSTLEFARGDEVMALRNNSRLGVLNGDRGRILGVDPSRRSVTFTAERTGSPITLPASYVEAGQLTHAYATTVHKAQGSTVDEALLLADDGLYQQAGYVGLSRGRDTNRLYAATEADVDLDELAAPDPTLHEPHPEPALAGTARRLSHDRSQQLALETIEWSAILDAAVEYARAARDAGASIADDLGAEVELPGDL